MYGNYDTNPAEWLFVGQNANAGNYMGKVEGSGVVSGNYAEVSQTLNSKQVDAAPGATKGYQVDVKIFNASKALITGKQEQAWLKLFADYGVSEYTLWTDGTGSFAGAALWRAAGLMDDGGLFSQDTTLIGVGKNSGLQQSVIGGQVIREQAKDLMVLDKATGKWSASPSGKASVVTRSGGGIEIKIGGKTVATGSVRYEGIYAYALLRKTNQPGFMAMVASSRGSDLSEKPVLNLAFGQEVYDLPLTDSGASAAAKFDGMKTADVTVGGLAPQAARMVYSFASDVTGITTDLDLQNVLLGAFGQNTWSAVNSTTGQLIASGSILKASETVEGVNKEELFLGGLSVSDYKGLISNVTGTGADQKLTIQDCLKGELSQLAPGAQTLSADPSGALLPYGTILTDSFTLAKVGTALTENKLKVALAFISSAKGLGLIGAKNLAMTSTSFKQFTAQDGATVSEAVLKAFNTQYANNTPLRDHFTVTYNTPDGAQVVRNFQFFAGSGDGLNAAGILELVTYNRATYAADSGKTVFWAVNYETMTVQMNSLPPTYVTNEAQMERDAFIKANPTGTKLGKLNSFSIAAFSAEAQKNKVEFTLVGSDPTFKSVLTVGQLDLTKFEQGRYVVAGDSVKAFLSALRTPGAIAPFSELYDLIQGSVKNMTEVRLTLGPDGTLSGLTSVSNLKDMTDPIATQPKDKYGVQVEKKGFNIRFGRDNGFLDDRSDVRFSLSGQSESYQMQLPLVQGFSSKDLLFVTNSYAQEIYSLWKAEMTAKESGKISDAERIALYNFSGNGANKFDTVMSWAKDRINNMSKSYKEFDAPCFASYRGASGVYAIMETMNDPSMLNDPTAIEARGWFEGTDAQGTDRQIFYSVFGLAMSMGKEVEEWGINQASTTVKKFTDGFLTTAIAGKGEDLAKATLTFSYAAKAGTGSEAYADALKKGEYSVAAYYQTEKVLTASFMTGDMFNKEAYALTAQMLGRGSAQYSDLGKNLKFGIDVEAVLSYSLSSTVFQPGASLSVVVNDYRVLNDEIAVQKSFAKSTGGALDSKVLNVLNGSKHFAGSQRLMITVSEAGDFSFTVKIGALRDVRNEVERGIGIGSIFQAGSIVAQIDQFLGGFSNRTAASDGILEFSLNSKHSNWFGFASNNEGVNFYREYAKTNNGNGYELRGGVQKVTDANWFGFTTAKYETYTVGRDLQTGRIGIYQAGADLSKPSSAPLIAGASFSETGHLVFSGDYNSSTLSVFGGSRLRYELYCDPVNGSSTLSVQNDSTMTMALWVKGAVATANTLKYMIQSTVSEAWIGYGQMRTEGGRLGAVVGSAGQGLMAMGAGAALILGGWVVAVKAATAAGASALLIKAGGYGLMYVGVSMGRGMITAADYQKNILEKGMTWQEAAAAAGEGTVLGNSLAFAQEMTLNLAMFSFFGAAGAKIGEAFKISANVFEGVGDAFSAGLEKSILTGIGKGALKLVANNFSVGRFLQTTVYMGFNMAVGMKIGADILTVFTGKLDAESLSLNLRDGDWTSGNIMDGMWKSIVVMYASIQSQSGIAALFSNLVSPQQWGFVLTFAALPVVMQGIQAGVTGIVKGALGLGQKLLAGMGVGTARGIGAVVGGIFKIPTATVAGAIQGFFVETIGAAGSGAMSAMAGFAAFSQITVLWNNFLKGIFEESVKEPILGKLFLGFMDDQSGEFAVEMFDMLDGKMNGCARAVQAQTIQTVTALRDSAAKAGNQAALVTSLDSMLDAIKNDRWDVAQAQFATAKTICDTLTAQPGQSAEMADLVQAANNFKQIQKQADRNAAELNAAISDPSNVLQKVYGVEQLTAMKDMITQYAFMEVGTISSQHDSANLLGLNIVAGSRFAAQGGNFTGRFSGVSSEITNFESFLTHYKVSAKQAKVIAKMEASQLSKFGQVLGLSSARLVNGGTGNYTVNENFIRNAYAAAVLPGIVSGTVTLTEDQKKSMNQDLQDMGFAKKELTAFDRLTAGATGQQAQYLDLLTERAATATESARGFLMLSVSANTPYFRPVAEALELKSGAVSFLEKIARRESGKFSQFMTENAGTLDLNNLSGTFGGSFEAVLFRTALKYYGASAATFTWGERVVLFGSIATNEFANVGLIDGNTLSRAIMDQVGIGANAFASRDAQFADRMKLSIVNSQAKTPEKFRDLCEKLGVTKGMNEKLKAEWKSVSGNLEKMDQSDFALFQQVVGLFLSQSGAFRFGGAAFVELCRSAMIAVASKTANTQNAQDILVDIIASGVRLDGFGFGDSDSMTKEEMKDFLRRNKTEEARKTEIREIVAKKYNAWAKTYTEKADLCIELARASNIPVSPAMAAYLAARNSYRSLLTETSALDAQVAALKVSLKAKEKALFIAQNEKVQKQDVIEKLMEEIDAISTDLHGVHGNAAKPGKVAELAAKKAALATAEANFNSTKGVDAAERARLIGRGFEILQGRAATDLEAKKAVEFMQTSFAQAAGEQAIGKLFATKFEIAEGLANQIDEARERARKGDSAAYDYLVSLYGTAENVRAQVETDLITLLTSTSRVVVGDKTIQTEYDGRSVRAYYDQTVQTLAGQSVLRDDLRKRSEQDPSNEKLKAQLEKAQRRIARAERLRQAFAHVFEATTGQPLNDYATEQERTEMVLLELLKDSKTTDSALKSLIAEMSAAAQDENGEYSKDKLRVWYVAWAKNHPDGRNLLLQEGKRIQRLENAKLGAEDRSSPRSARRALAQQTQFFWRIKNYAVRNLGLLVQYANVRNNNEALKNLQEALDENVKTAEAVLSQDPQSELKQVTLAKARRDLAALTAMPSDASVQLLFDLLLRMGLITAETVLDEDTLVRKLNELFGFAGTGGPANIEKLIEEVEKSDAGLAAKIRSELKKIQDGEKGKFLTFWTHKSDWAKMQMTVMQLVIGNELIQPGNSFENFYESMTPAEQLKLSDKGQERRARDIRDGQSSVKRMKRDILRSFSSKIRKQAKAQTEIRGQKRGSWLRQAAKAYRATVNQSLKKNMSVIEKVRAFKGNLYVQSMLEQLGFAVIVEDIKDVAKFKAELKADAAFLAILGIEASDVDAMTAEGLVTLITELGVEKDAAVIAAKPAPGAKPTPAVQAAYEAAKRTAMIKKLSELRQINLDAAQAEFDAANQSYTAIHADAAKTEAEKQAAEDRVTTANEALDLAQQAFDDWKKLDVSAISEQQIAKELRAVLELSFPQGFRSYEEMQMESLLDRPEILAGTLRNMDLMPRMWAEMKAIGFGIWGFLTGFWVAFRDSRQSGKSNWIENGEARARWRLWSTPFEKMNKAEIVRETSEWGRRADIQRYEEALATADERYQAAITARSAFIPDAAKSKSANAKQRAALDNRVKAAENAKKSAKTSLEKAKIAKQEALAKLGDRLNEILKAAGALNYTRNNRTVTPLRNQLVSDLFKAFIEKQTFDLADFPELNEVKIALDELEAARKKFNAEAMRIQGGSLGTVLNTARASLAAAQKDPARANEIPGLQTAVDNAKNALDAAIEAERNKPDGVTAKGNEYQKKVDSAVKEFGAKGSKDQIAQILKLWKRDAASIQLGNEMKLLEQMELRVLRMKLFSEDVRRGREAEETLLNTNIEFPADASAQDAFQKVSDSLNKEKGFLVALLQDNPGFKLAEDRLKIVNEMLAELEDAKVAAIAAFDNHKKIGEFYAAFVEGAVAKSGSSEPSKEDAKVMVRLKIFNQFLKDAKTVKNMQDKWKAEAKKTGGVLGNDIIVAASATDLAIAAMAYGKYRVNSGIRDIQFIATLLAARGWNAVELATGEGKTLLTAAVSMVNALSGKGSIAVVTKDASAKDAFSEWNDAIDVAGFSVKMRLNDSYDDQRMLLDGATTKVRMTDAQIREAYDADITYVSVQNWAFDFSHDKLQAKAGEMKLIEGGKHGRKFKEISVSIDEMDSVLIDQAMTSFIRSQGGGKLLKGDLYHVRRELAELANSLTAEREQWVVDVKTGKANKKASGKEILVSEDGTSAFAQSSGERKAVKLFEEMKKSGKITEAFFNTLVKKRTTALVGGDQYELKELGRQYLNNAVQAQYVYDQGVNYWIDNGEVKLISKELGITQQGQRLNELHQAIEARIRMAQERGERAFTHDKNGNLIGVKLADGTVIGTLMEIRAENLTESSVTARDVLLSFGKVSGMSGTLNIGQISEDLRELYGMTCFTIPSFSLNRRRDHFLVFGTDESRDAQAQQLISDAIAEGRSVLINAHTDKERNEIFELLEKASLGQAVDLAKFGVDSEDSEKSLVTAIGAKPTILVATNIAGRGTNFSPDKLMKQAGGLLQINWGINKRISTDKQASGRAGRQGAMGDSYTLVRQGKEDIYSSGLLRSQRGFFGNWAARRLAARYESWIKRIFTVQTDNGGSMDISYMGQGAADMTIAEFLDSLNGWQRFWLVQGFGGIGTAQWREITSGKYATIGEAVYRIAQSNVEKSDSEQLQFRAKRGDNTFAAQVLTKEMLEKVKEEVALATKLRYNGGIPTLIRDAVFEAMNETWDGKTLDLDSRVDQGDIKDGLIARLEEKGMPIQFSEAIRELCQNNAGLNRAALSAQIEAALTEQAITSLAESMIGRTTGKWFQALQKIERDHGYSKIGIKRWWNNRRYNWAFNREFKNYVKSLEKVWLDSRGEADAVSQIKVFGAVQLAFRATVVKFYYWVTRKSQLKKDRPEWITEAMLDESVGDRSRQVAEDRAKEAYAQANLENESERVKQQYSRTQVGNFEAPLMEKDSGRRYKASQLEVQRKTNAAAFTAPDGVSVHRAAGTSVTAARVSKLGEPNSLGQRVPAEVLERINLCAANGWQFGIAKDANGIVYAIRPAAVPGQYEYVTLGDLPSLPPEAYRQLMRLQGDSVLDPYGRSLSVRLNDQGVILIGRSEVGAGVRLAAGTVLVNSIITTDRALATVEEQLKLDSLRAAFPEGTAEAVIAADPKVIEAVTALAKAKEKADGLKGRVIGKGAFMMVGSALAATQDSVIEGNALIESSYFKGAINLGENSRMSEVSMGRVQRNVNDDGVSILKRIDRTGTITLGAGSEAYASRANTIEVKAGRMQAYQGISSGSFRRTGHARSFEHRDGVILKQFGFSTRASGLWYWLIDLLAMRLAVANTIWEDFMIANQNIKKHGFGLGNIWTEYRSFLGKMFDGTGVKQVILAVAGVYAASLLAAALGALSLGALGIVGVIAGLYAVYLLVGFVISMAHGDSVMQALRWIPSQAGWSVLVPISAIGGVLLGSFTILGVGVSPLLVIGGLYVIYLGLKLAGKAGSSETGLFASSWKVFSDFRRAIDEDVNLVLRNKPGATVGSAAVTLNALKNVKGISQDTLDLLAESLSNPDYKQTDAEETAVKDIQGRMAALKATTLFAKGFTPWAIWGQIRAARKIRRELAGLLADAILGINGKTGVEEKDKNRKGLLLEIESQLAHGQLNIYAGMTAALCWIPAAGTSFSDYNRLDDPARTALNAKWLAENKIPNVWNIKVVLSRSASTKLGRYWKLVAKDSDGRTWEDREGAQAVVPNNFKSEVAAKNSFARAGFTALSERWDKGSSLHELLHFNSPMRKNLTKERENTAIGLEEVYNFYVQYISGAYEYGLGFYNVERAIEEKMTQYGECFGAGEEGKRIAKAAFEAVLYLESVGMQRAQIMALLGRITNVSDLLQFRLYSKAEIAAMMPPAQSVATQINAERVALRGKDQAAKAAAKTRREAASVAAKRAVAAVVPSTVNIEGEDVVRPVAGDVMVNLDQSLAAGLPPVWTRIRAVVSGWMAPGVTFDVSMAALRAATPKEQLWMLYELKRIADGGTSNAGKAQGFLNEFYASEYAANILIAVVRVAGKVLHGEPKEDQIMGQLLSPVLLAAPEHLQLNVTEFTGWYPPATPHFNDTADGRRGAEEEYYRKRTQELVDRHAWNELENIVRGVGGSDVIRAWTVYYLQNNHRYNPEVKKILSYQDPVSMPGLKQLGLGVAGALAVAGAGVGVVALLSFMGVAGLGMLTFGFLVKLTLSLYSLYPAVRMWVSKKSSKHLEEFKKSILKAALKSNAQDETIQDIYQKLPVMIENARKGQYGIELKDEELRIALWKHAATDHRALRRLMDMSASLIPSGSPLNAGSAVTSAEAQALLNEALAVQELGTRAEKRTVFDVIEDALVGAGVLTQSTLIALTNYKTWGETRAREELLVAAFEEYLMLGLGADEAASAMSRFAGVFPKKDARSVAERAIREGRAEEAARRDPAVRKYLSEHFSLRFLVADGELLDPDRVKKQDPAVLLASVRRDLEANAGAATSPWIGSRPLFDGVLSAAAKADLDALAAAGNWGDYETTLMRALTLVFHAQNGADKATEQMRDLRGTIRIAEHLQRDRMLEQLNSWSKARRREAAKWIYENLVDLDELKSKYGLTEEHLMHASFERSQDGIGGNILLDPKHLPEDFFIKDGESGASEPFGRPQQYLRYTFMLKGYAKHTAIHENEGHNRDNLYAADYDGRINGFRDQKDFVQKKLSLINAELHSFLLEIFVSPEWIALKKIKDPAVRDAQKARLINAHMAKILAQYLPGYLSRVEQNLQDRRYGALVLNPDLARLIRASAQAEAEALLKADDGPVFKMLSEAADLRSFSDKFLETYRAEAPSKKPASASRIRADGVSDSVQKLQAVLVNKPGFSGEEAQPGGILEAVSDYAGGQLPEYKAIVTPDYQIYERPSDDPSNINLPTIGITTHADKVPTGNGFDNRIGMANILSINAQIQSLAKAGMKFGKIRIIVTTEEETGKGVTKVPLKYLQGVDYFLTMDSQADALEEGNWNSVDILSSEDPEKCTPRAKGALRHHVEFFISRGNALPPSFNFYDGGRYPHTAVEVSNSQDSLDMADVMLQTLIDLNQAGRISDPNQIVRVLAEAFEKQGIDDFAMIDGYTAVNGAVDSNGDYFRVLKELERGGAGAKGAPEASRKEVRTTVLKPSASKGDSLAGAGRPAPQVSAVPRAELRPAAPKTVSAVPASAPAVGSWMEQVQTEIRQRILTAGGTESDVAAFLNELNLSLPNLKIELLKLSTEAERELAKVFALYFLHLQKTRPSITQAVQGFNHIIALFDPSQFTGSTERRLAIVEDRGMTQPSRIIVNPAPLLDTSVPAQVRAMKLGMVFSHEERHLELRDVLKKDPTLLRPENKGLYDTIQDLLAYATTLQDMKNGVVAMQRARQADPSLDLAKPIEALEQNIANITLLWQSATGMKLETNLFSEILALNGETEIEDVRSLLRKLKVSILNARQSPGGMGVLAQIALVGKPVDEVLKYNDAYGVAVHVPAQFEESWSELIYQFGFEKHIFVMDSKGALKTGSRRSVRQLSEDFPEHAVAAMPESFAGLEFLDYVLGRVAQKQMMALSFDPKKLTRDKARETLGFLNMLAMIGRNSIPEFIYQQTSAGLGGAGAASSIPTVTAFAEVMKQSFMSELVAAQSA